MEAAQTRRSEESEQLQQFSTPITLGFVAAEAAALTSADVVLEPSAGTGLLAIFAELARARLVLNEIADTRAGLLGRLFRGIDATRHNAEQIHDRLDPAIRPCVVLMNPPFSASPHIEGRFAEAAMRHIASALARLAEGERLVAITGRNVGPDQPAWRDGFVRLQEKARVVFTATIAGQAYPRHGTTIETRLTVIDRVPAEDPRAFPPSPGMAADVAELLGHVSRHVPPRTPVTGASPLPAPTVVVSRAPIVARPKAPQLNLVKRPAPMPDVVELAYETREWTSGASRLTANLYEGYAPQAIHFPGARRTRPSLSSRPLWPRSRRRAPPIARIYRRACSQLESSPTRSWKALSMPARRMPAISPVPTPSTRRTISFRRLPPLLRMPCVSGAIGSSATAPAPARAARSRRSFSTTGSRAGAARSGSRNPTS